MLERQFLRCGIKPLKIDLSKAVTGPEAFYVLDAEPLPIKQLTTLVEDASPLGRLFDMDGLRPDGKKVDREELHLEGRKCLICGLSLIHISPAARSCSSFIWRWVLDAGFRQQVRASATWVSMAASFRACLLYTSRCV